MENAIDKLEDRLDFTDAMYEKLLTTSAKHALDDIHAKDPMLSLKPFVVRCLNSIKNNGVNPTMGFYDVPMGFLMNVEKVYLEESRK